MQVTANTTKATKATSTPATKAKATAKAKATPAAATAAPAPMGLAAQAAAIVAAAAAQAAAPTATATAKVRTPAHTGGVFGHLCTVGRRSGKCWYATGSAGYNIGAVLCQHAAGGRKCAVAAAVAAGFSAGSATSCWGDLQAFNASLTAAGLPSLQTAYASAPATNAKGVAATVA